MFNQALFSELLANDRLIRELRYKLKTAEKKAKTLRKLHLQYNPKPKLTPLDGDVCKAVHK